MVRQADRRERLPARASKRAPASQDRDTPNLCIVCHTHSTSTTLHVCATRRKWCVVIKNLCQSGNIDSGGVETLQETLGSLSLASTPQLGPSLDPAITATDCLPIL